MRSGSIYDAPKVGREARYVQNVLVEVPLSTLHFKL